MYQPPPPPSYTGPGQPPPPYGGTTTTVYTHQPTHFNTILFREFPVAMQCQYCHASVTTSTRYESGTLTWVACFVIAFIGLWLGCCLIPFCLDGCKDVIHSCPNCHQMLGRFNRM
ncbi:lipopolysaccharide-induced tumor necrosis factor-alpha factor homolog [Crassostrea virginica]|uniref:Lipopolysaccharide-induced tumor necrosis factor-alpha factor homolog n=1 Tax=Crassostrea virginica TaxID=6565 RepID=A0A8B8CUW1_CRAVI|nr:lipopolysaccharide-induced tumor necrosis factor-alpha factor homolog [Crassostrea virginica]